MDAVAYDDLVMRRGAGARGTPRETSTQRSTGRVPAEPISQRPAGEPSTIVFVIKPGRDPIVAGRRIADPNASVSPAYPDRRPRENLPQTILLRTFVVSVAAGQEKEALKRAQADPDVERAYVGFHSGA